MAIHDHIRPGDRFHFLVVQSGPFKKQDHRQYVECLCDCGNVTVVKCRDIYHGHTKACGCWNRKMPRAWSVTHGKSRTATWRSYFAMMTRCRNPNSSHYGSYGGRGITVCERWGSFESFLADMGERPEGMTLDRIDVNGDYEPSNCRWATPEQQRNNRRDNRFLEFRGQRLTVAQWSRETGINEHALRIRVGLGWDAEKALTTPTRLGRNQYSTD